MMTRACRMPGCLLSALLLAPALAAEPLTHDLAPPELPIPQSVTADGNLAAIHQQGFAHWAAISQAGAGNQGAIVQHGRQHIASIEQRGDGNLASILQFGLMPQQAGITQLGDDNRARIEQRPGTRTDIDILQRGDAMRVDITVKR